MKTYDEITLEEILEPDLTAGYTYESRRLVAHHDAVEAKYDIRVMKDTDGLRERYLVSPAKAAWDEYEDCMLYHAYNDSDVQEEMSKKEEELSNSCNAIISAGTVVTLSDRSIKQFSYSIEDQANVSEMFNAILMGATSYPYHANGESCMMYSAIDIMTIYTTLSSLKTAQITYYNQLRQYLRTLTTVPSIRTVVYGQQLEGTYFETYTTLLAQAAAEMEKVVTRVMAATGGSGSKEEETADDDIETSADPTENPANSEDNKNDEQQEHESKPEQEEPPVHTDGKGAESIDGEVSSEDDETEEKKSVV